MSQISLAQILFVIYSFTTTVHAGVVNSMSPAIGTSFSNVQGTYWNGATFDGACLLQTYQRPQGMEYVAINKDVNGHAEYCGACISIKPKVPNGLGPVVAIVSSYCDNCPHAALDLPASLYDRLMTNKPGRPGLSHFDWKVVPCPFDTKPAIVNKQGSSRWHLSMMIADSKFPIASVTIDSGGKSMSAHKMNYNYWELDNQPALAERVDVKVTCVNGGSFLVKSVDPSSMTPTLAPSDCGGAAGTQYSQKKQKKTDQSKTTKTTSKTSKSIMEQ